MCADQDQRQQNCGTLKFTKSAAALLNVLDDSERNNIDNFRFLDLMRGYFEYARTHRQCPKVHKKRRKKKQRTICDERTTKRHVLLLLLLLLLHGVHVRMLHTTNKRKKNEHNELRMFPFKIFDCVIVSLNNLKNSRCLCHRFHLYVLVIYLSFGCSFYQLNKQSYLFSMLCLFILFHSRKRHHCIVPFY